ncbi:38325_t:CDS:2, partial [Gigaspora margarita]
LENIKQKDQQIAVTTTKYIENIPNEAHARQIRKNLSFYGHANVLSFMLRERTKVVYIKLEFKNEKRESDLLNTWVVHYEKGKMIRIIPGHFDEKTLLERAKYKRSKFEGNIEEYKRRRQETERYIEEYKSSMNSPKKDYKNLDKGKAPNQIERTIQRSFSSYVLLKFAKDVSVFIKGPQSNLDNKQRSGGPSRNNSRSSYFEPLQIDPDERIHKS